MHVLYSVCLELSCHRFRMVHIALHKALSCAPESDVEFRCVSVSQQTENHYQLIIFTSLLSFLKQNDNNLGRCYKVSTH